MSKLKIFLLALLVVLLVISSYLVYEFKIKKYDTQDEEVTAIVEKGMEIKLPNGQVIKLDKNGEIIEDASNTSGLLSLLENAQNISIENAMEANDSKNPEGAYKNGSTKEGNDISQIKAKYEQTFLALENEARNRLNSLIKHAKSEYSSKKAKGEKISYAYFYRKYSAAAKEVELTMDQAVGIVIKLLEAELQQNGYDSSHAKSYLTEYQNTKGSLRKSILNKAISF